jgi:hypothetical protein
MDWDHVRQEVYGKGTTIKQIHQEVAPEVTYLSFWRAFRDQVPHQASLQDVTIRLNHKPGEKSQIDFCDGLLITDPITGKTTTTQFFLGRASVAYVLIRRLGYKLTDFARFLGRDIATLSLWLRGA